jgi:hypothetical protein
MDLLQNPFYILTASPCDSRRRIMELADERSLLLDSSEIKEARAILSTPRKRLSAEIGWLPGMGERTGELLSLLSDSPADLLAVNKLSSIARANLLVAGIARLSDPATEEVVRWILEIARAFEGIDVKELRVIINEERNISDFPEVSDLSDIEAEIQEQRRYYRKVIKSALDNLSPKNLVKAVTVAVELATNDGKKHGPILIADLADMYEVEAQEFLDKEEENMRTLIEKLRTALDTNQPDSVLTPTVNQLIQVVKNWDTVAQPIQVSAKSRGLWHEGSYRVARSIRELAIYHMCNEHGKLDFSQQLTIMLQEVFAEVGEVSERIAQDADDLHDIAKQRDQWRKEITYEANIGAFFVNKLRISPEGIEWKGSRCDLDSITRVRWGGTRYSTGITYSIIFGYGSYYNTFINLANEEVYNNFVDRLWKTVGVRLLMEYLKGLRDGKQYRFGSTVISDYGLELNRNHIFSNEKVFCRWSELLIMNSPGGFCISKEHDWGLRNNFSYLEEDNIHVLEAGIRMLLKRNGDRLSSLLE